MKLKEITIRNYKSCKDTVVNFNETLTALIGVNGAGKTNILTAINTLLESNFIASNGENDIQSNHPFITILFEQENYHVELKIADVVNKKDLWDIIYKWRIKELFPQWLEIPLWAITDPLDMQKIKFLFSEIDITDEVQSQFMSQVWLIRNYIRSTKYYSAAYFTEPINASPILDINRHRGGTT
ncbi:hypothetical protein FACS1894164_14230 [Spirochaetia bacterium]|nr:hypothetical protein FACS1894164_14230 [Spirochaetia bacterium]